MVKEGFEGGPTAMLIRIFGSRDREPYGDIVHGHLKKPVPYQGSAELVLRIDSISRSLNLPVSEDTFRSIRRPGGESTNILPEEYWQEEDTHMETIAGQNLAADQGSAPDQNTSFVLPGVRAAARTAPHSRVQDTIYLQLIGHQHTSIQGRIWGRMTKKKYVSFRSALELLYLLSEAV